MTKVPAAPGRWSADLCQADSTCRGGGARASSADGLDLDGVGQLLLHVNGVCHEQDLAETSPEPGQRAEQPVAVFAVESAEHLVEHEQPDRPTGEEVDLLADGDAQREVGQIRLRTGVPVEWMAGAPHP